MEYFKPQDKTFKCFLQSDKKINDERQGYSSDSYFDHQVRILLLHFQKIDVAEWENS